MQLTTIDEQTKELEVVKPVEIPFNGSYIEAVEHEGVIWVGVRKTSEDLGLASNGQTEKIKNDKVLNGCSKMILSHDSIGRKQEQLFINLAGYSLWLARIQESRIKEEFRPHLGKYQLEAAEVLKSHFTQKEQIPPVILDYLYMDEDERAIAYFTQKREKKLLQEQNEQLAEENKKLGDKAEGFDRFINSEGLIATADFAKTLENGWGVTLLHTLLRARGIFKETSNCPKQIYAKYLVRKWETNKRGLKVPVLYVKNEGIKFIHKLIKEFESLIGKKKITKKLIENTYGSGTK